MVRVFPSAPPSRAERHGCADWAGPESRSHAPRPRRRAERPAPRRRCVRPKWSGARHAPSRRTTAPARTREIDPDDPFAHSMPMEWLEVHRGEAPLVVSFPHTGTDIPSDIEGAFLSPWLARRDADWWVHRLYDFAKDMGATTIRTPFSRSVIDVNRDPSGASLYPGQATTELCPTTTFDGEALYRGGMLPDGGEIALRRSTFFDPYHSAIQEAIVRLRARHATVVLYDC